MVYQGPDTVLSPIVSGSSVEYTNISLSGPETRKPSEITEGTAYQGEDRADFSLRKSIYNEENNKEDCTFQGLDIPINSCENQNEMEEQFPEYISLGTLPVISSNSLNTANSES